MRVIAGRVARKIAYEAVVAGLMAGVVSTLVQMLLWLCLGYEFPDILYRDTRMAAAISLGPATLHDEMTWRIWCVASVLHFALSVLYAAVLLVLTTSLHWRGRLLVGAVSGCAIYVMNMYGFVMLFPWFVASREPATFLAHLVFGMAATIDWAAWLRALRLRRRAM